MFKFGETLTGFEDRSIPHFATPAIARRNRAELPVAVPTVRKSHTVPRMIHRTGGAIAVEEEAWTLVPSSGAILLATRHGVQ